MTINLYRADLLGLSTDEKPSNQIDGTTFYEVDTSNFYIYYKGTWYKQGAEESQAETTENVVDTRELEELTKEVVEPIIEEPVEK